MWNTWRALYITFSLVYCILRVYSHGFWFCLLCKLLLPYISCCYPHPLAKGVICVSGVLYMLWYDAYIPVSSLCLSWHCLVLFRPWRRERFVVLPPSLYLRHAFLTVTITLQAPALIFKHLGFLTGITRLITAQDSAPLLSEASALKSGHIPQLTEKFWVVTQVIKYIWSFRLKCRKKTSK